MSATAIEFLVWGTRKHHECTGQWPLSALVNDYWKGKLDEEIAAGASLDGLPDVVPFAKAGGMCLCTLVCADTMLYRDPVEALERWAKSQEEFGRKFNETWGGKYESRPE